MKTNKFNCLTPPEKIFLPDGTELRLCVGAVPRQGHAKLYCSAMGIFFSLSSRGLNQIKCYHVKNFKAKPNVHSNYPRMTNFRGTPYCHLLVAFAWVGPQPEGYEVDHIDGNIRNSAAYNLEYVTPEENRRRAKENNRNRLTH